MTVQDTTPRITFVGTGAQLVFAFTFRVDNISWLSVDFTDDFDTFTLNGDQDGDPGGTVEYTVAPPLAQELTVVRDTPNAQDLDYTRYDPFDSESHEFGLDKLTMQIQDLQDLIASTLTQDFDLLGNVDFATKENGSMVYWDLGSSEWKDTADQVRFVGGQFQVDAVALFQGNVSIDANLSSINGNFHRFLNPTLVRWADIQVPDLINFQITTPNLVDVLFTGFSGRVKQDANILAYVSEIVTSHLGLTDIGVNTHAVLDAHLANAAIHFTEGSIDHLAISNIGVNSHAVIDTHIGTPSIHFTVGSIDHTAIANIGVNGHVAIDVHIADANIHFGDAPADASSYVRNNNAWVAETVQSFGEYRGVFDASIGTFPVTTNQGDWFNCTVAGTVDGQAFIVGDILVALIDNPSTVTFAANWSLIPNISVTDHTLLTNIGVNTHVQLDTHLADGSIHFTEASISHLNIADIGVNTHAVIDVHLADATVHFTEASIDHANIANIGVNSHAVIDSNFVIVAAHLADADIHFLASTVGDVFKVGTPNIMEIGVWTGDGTLEGNDNLQWDTSVNSGRLEIKCVTNDLDDIGLLLIDPDSVLNPDGWQWCTGQAGLFDGTLILSHDPTDVINNRDVTYLPGNRPTFGFGIACPSNTALGDEGAGALAFFMPRDTTGREETKVSFVGFVGGTGHEGVFSIEGFAYGDTGLQFHRLAHFVIDADYHLHVDILGDLDMTGYIHPNTATDAELDDITDAINTDIGKTQGAMVYNTTQDIPVYATGNADGSVWVDGAGTTVNTPV